MPAVQIRQFMEKHRPEMVDFLAALVLAESPSSEPETQVGVQTLLREALSRLDYEVTHLPGQQTGGHLLAQPRHVDPAQPQQLLVGHCDTVWPLGTLREMPLKIEEDKMHGPGVYDMKGGLTQMVFALRALRELGLPTAVTPICFINSDEEIGSPESTPHIEALAQQVCRALILEPALGPTGKLKTARKGVANYKVVVHGRAAHAGLDPEKGVSAILEMSHIIQQLFALNDPANGVSVNVGIVQGGLRTNVVAPECTAWVDVRVPRQPDTERIDTAVNQLPPTLPGASLEISGGIGRVPLERTPRNRRLWAQAQAAGLQMGLELAEGMAGGGSDGNTTSRFTATLDGLGPVGDGAHARHEFLYIDTLVERATLLTLLLLAEQPED
ncbi:MAG: M20 family metallopeptidase [Anaerolineae bacterium]|nr:M20 family metallopeptidase [Anaerolineae bacterium]